MTVRRSPRLLVAVGAVAGLAACHASRLQSIIAAPGEDGVDSGQVLTPEAGVDMGQALTAGLVAHWTCNETGGKVLHDSSGQGHDGQISGGTFTTGLFGNALALESGQYVTVPGFPNATSSWTVSVWLYMKSPLPEFGDASLLSTDLASTGGWAMNINDVSMETEFRYWDGTQTTSDGYESYPCPGCLAGDRWNHLVYVVDGAAKTLLLYTDGANRRPMNIQDTIKAGSTDLFIGRGTSASLYYTGLLDDITIFSRALSSSEVQLVRSAEVPSP